MVLEWPDPRCILCLGADRPLTNAHVIAASVGGRLAVPFLCRDCNSWLGHSVEAGLKKDPSVRLAIEGILGKAPNVARTLRRGQLFIADAAGVRVVGTPEGRGYRVLTSPQPDGSRVKSPNDAREEIVTTLRRRSASEIQIRTALSRHDNAPMGEYVPLGFGVAVRKGAVSEFDAMLDEPLVTETCPLAIAYLFLACVVGKTIYAAALQPVRDSLTARTADSAAWKVDWRIVRIPYEPWHGIAVDAIEPHVVIQIRLFAQIAWHVHFTQVRGNASSAGLAYRVDLDGTESIGGNGATTLAA